MAALKKAIEALDPAPDKKKEITLALNLLFELAEQKKQLQEEWLKNYLRTAGTPENPTIPITNIIAWHNETRAYVKDDASKLVSEIASAVKKFVAGGSDNIINGISELMSGAITAILGAGTGSVSEMHSYYIMVEGLSIIRIDLTAWQRHIEAEGITKKIENAMTFSAVKSSVDVNKITFNTFLQAYNAQLMKMKIPENEVKKYIIEAKEVFDLLRNNNSHTSFVSNSIEPSSLSVELCMPGHINFLLN